MAMHYRSEDGIIHCEGINSGDYMLCGIAPEGECGDEHCVATTATINCKNCIAIIEFSRRIHAGEWAVTRRAQR